MKRALVVAALVVAVVTLSGCDEDLTIAERVANRAECEAADGTYREWRAGVFDITWRWQCDLERPVEGDGK